MKPGARWSLIVLGLLGGSFVIHGIMLVYALTDPSFAVEPNYEQTAADWDDVAAQHRMNRALGWSVDLRAAATETPGLGRLVATVIDRDGEPVDGAVVRVEGFHNARAGHRATSTLAPDGSGRYAGTMLMRRPGVWEFRVVVESGVSRLTATVRVSVATHRPARGGNS